MNKSFLKTTKSMFLVIHLAFSFASLNSMERNGEQENQITIYPANKEVNDVLLSLITNNGHIFKKASAVDEIYTQQNESMHPLSSTEKETIEEHIKSQEKNVKKDKLDEKSLNFLANICFLAIALNPNSENIKKTLHAYHEKAKTKKQPQNNLEKLLCNYFINTKDGEVDANKIYTQAKAITEQEQVIHKNLKTNQEVETTLSKRATDIRNKIEELKKDLERAEEERHNNMCEQQKIILQNQICYFVKQNYKQNLMAMLETTKISYAQTEENEISKKKDLVESEAKNKNLVPRLKNEIAEIQKEKNLLEYQIRDLEQKISRVELSGTTTGNLLRSWI